MSGDAVRDGLAPQGGHGQPAILRLIGERYRRPKGTHRSWQGCDLDLSGVIIDGNMNFEDASFSSSRVSFDRAVFSGDELSFVGVTFSDGVVWFGTARGPAPSGLLAAVGTPPSAVVVLPAAWLPANP